jgi:hypothetical protein
METTKHTHMEHQQQDGHAAQLEVHSPIVRIEFPSFPFPRRLQGARRTQTNALNNCA